MCALRAAGGPRSASARASKPSRPRMAARQLQQLASAARACTKCGTTVPPNFKFCQICGTRVVVAQDFDVETRVGPRRSDDRRYGRSRSAQAGRSTLFFGGAAQARTREADADPRRRRRRRLVHARRHRSPRGSRRMPDLVPRRSVSSRRFTATSATRTAQLVVRDEGSLNGVYVRISGTVTHRARHRRCSSASRCSRSRPRSSFEDLPDAEARTTRRA